MSRAEKYFFKKNQKSEERLFFLIDISKLPPYDLQEKHCFPLANLD